MRSFRFEKIWLLSEREQKARAITLSPDATALVGTNHTGKSTVTRSLFSVFGCSTRPLGGEWDAEAIVAVEFNIEEQKHTLLKRGGLHTLFDSDKQPLWAASDSGELRDRLAELLDFNLFLTANKTNEVRPARPAFFFVPFFIDQDGSWDSSWGTFRGLGEFQQWERATLDLALGIRPPEYWKAANELAKKKRELEDLTKEQKVLEDAREKLVQKFPRAPWYRDAMAFRRELKTLEAKASALAIEQDAARSRAAEAAAARDSLQAQIRLLDGALTAHAADMVFLDSHDVGADIVCPTCGTPHEHTFHERLNLEAEADELRQLRASLKARIAIAEREAAAVNSLLAELDSQAKQIDDLLNTERGKLKLREVIDRAGIENALRAFDEQRLDLDVAHGNLLRAISEIEEALERLDDKKRAKEIRAYFNSLYSAFAVQLEVPASLRTRKGEVKTKPQQGGSGGPRAVLAYYFALAHTAAKYSPSLIPPLVIDSPHQKAQDDINRPKVTEFIVNNRVPGQQLIVGIEEALPQSVRLAESDRQVHLTEKYGLLRSSEFKEVLAELMPYLSASSDFMRAKRPPSA